MMKVLLQLLLAACFAVASFGAEIDDIVARYGQSVPKIKATNNGSNWSTGSGVYLGGKWVLSAKHVTSDSNRIFAIFNTGRPIEATDYVYSKNTDQVLIKLASDPGVPAVPLVRCESAPVVYGAGYDHGRRFRVWSGRPVSAWNANTSEFVGEGGAVSGNSGGPVLTSSGCVGNLWGRQSGSCVFTRNEPTLNFIQRAAVRYPDLRAILPEGNGGSLNPPADVPISCPTCPPQTPQVEIRTQPAPPVVIEPQTVTPQSKGQGVFDAIIKPRIIPQIQGNSGAFDVPIDIPVTIRMQFQPSMSLGLSNE